MSRKKVVVVAETLLLCEDAKDDKVLLLLRELSSAIRKGGELTSDRAKDVLMQNQPGRKVDLHIGDAKRHGPGRFIFGNEYGVGVRYSDTAGVFSVDLLYEEPYDGVEKARVDCRLAEDLEDRFFDDKYMDGTFPVKEKDMEDFVDYVRGHHGW